MVIYPTTLRSTRWWRVGQNQVRCSRFWPFSPIYVHLGVGPLLCYYLLRLSALRVPSISFWTWPSSLFSLDLNVLLLLCSYLFLYCNHRYHLLNSYLNLFCLNMASTSQAYTGLWVDWSKGRILGATLTLSERKGALLTNALALFVQLAGSHFWGLMKYAIHQMRASEKPHDALFYQQQAILRNRSSAETVLGLLSISRVWRSPEIRPFRRCLLLLLIAGLHMCGFILAAIFQQTLPWKMPELCYEVQRVVCGLYRRILLKQPMLPRMGIGPSSLII